ncbi:MAG: hypothetical protein WC445_01315 [Patescibacteria group bacterium]
MVEKNEECPRGEKQQLVAENMPEGWRSSTRKVMVVVVPLKPSPFVVPEESYDFSLPLFGGTIPHRGS